MSFIPSDFFSTSFVEYIMQQFNPQAVIEVNSVERFPVDNSSSILVALTATQSSRVIGHFGLNVVYFENQVPRYKRMVMKIKPHAHEICEMINGLSQVCGNQLATIYPDFKNQTGFAHTHITEHSLYSKHMNSLMPDIFGLYADDQSGIYIILMEYLENASLLNAVMKPSGFTDIHIKTALSQIAVFHATYYCQPLESIKVPYKHSGQVAVMEPLWEALLENAFYYQSYHYKYKTPLKDISSRFNETWKELDSYPKTLIHNDFNPRNVCFKSIGKNLKLCVYDWELATWHAPQYDVIEFLCFVLDHERYHLRSSYIKYYYQILSIFVKPHFMDENTFKRGLELATIDFGLHRLPMYLMAHKVSPYPFLERVVASYFNTLSQLQMLKG